MAAGSSESLRDDNKQGPASTAKFEERHWSGTAISPGPFLDLHVIANSLIDTDNYWEVGQCLPFPVRFVFLAGATGLEPAASCLTGRRSNQLNYAPAKLTILTSLLSVSFYDFYALQGFCDSLAVPGFSKA